MGKDKERLKGKRSSASDIRGFVMTEDESRRIEYAAIMKAVAPQAEEESKEEPKKPAKKTAKKEDK